MKVKLIKTEDEYQKALAKMETLFDVTPDSKDFDEAAMEIKRIDMVKYFGSRGKVSEVLNRQRNLTMIKKLHKDFGIPAESLIA